LIAIAGMVLAAVSVALLFTQSLFYVAMVTSIVFAVAALVFAIIGLVKTKSVFSIITLIVSIVVLLPTVVIVEMLFEYVFIR